MLKVSDLLWSLIPFSLPLIAGLYLFYLAFTTSPEALTVTGLSAKNMYYVISAIFIIFPLMMGLGLFFYETRKDIQESSLMNDGIRGEAEILRRKETGLYRNEQPQVKFLLKLTVPGEEPYQLKYKEYVNLQDVEDAIEGAKIAVMVDSNNPKNILLVYE